MSKKIYLLLLFPANLLSPFRRRIRHTDGNILFETFFETFKCFRVTIKKHPSMQFNREQLKMAKSYTRWYSLCIIQSNLEDYDLKEITIFQKGLYFFQLLFKNFKIIIIIEHIYWRENRDVIFIIVNPVSVVFITLGKKTILLNPGLRYIWSKSSDL